MALIFESYVKSNRERFISRVKEISRDLDIDPNWLMSVMWFESRINHTAVNPVSNAYGLIQFMPSTLQSMGLNEFYIRQVSNVKQLDYVRQYLMPYKGRMNSFVDVYFAVFFPLAMDKDDDFVLQTSRLSAGLIARQNPAFDRNGNGQITVAEVKETLLERVPEQFREALSPTVVGGSIVALVIVIAIVIYFVKFR